LPFSEYRAAHAVMLLQQAERKGAVVDLKQDAAQSFVV
jgi:hypothetical protein